MIPHIQTLFGKGQGDCFRTCVESILGLELASSPNFCAWDAATWFEQTTEWLILNTRATDLLRVVVGTEETLYQSGMDLLLGVGIKDYHGQQECLVIEDVMTSRGLKHSIVSRVRLKPFSMVKKHDPHPDGGDTWPENEWFSFYAIVAEGLWVV